MNQQTPKPYISLSPKAFVLGCDPTAFKAEDKKKPAKERMPIPFKTVFGLDDGLKYFGVINANLSTLGLDYKTDVYIQNLVINFQDEETSKNKNWESNAINAIPARKQEFDKIDPSHKLPVFLTSEQLYKVLLNKNEPRLNPCDLYKLEDIVISAKKNMLGRPLIALYRHWAYSLNNEKRVEYRNKVKSYLKFL